MMGKSHSTSSVAAGLGVAPLLGLSTLVSAAPFVLMTGGAGILPDLDHRSSSASRLFGPVGNTVSGALRGASNWLYQRTKGPRDEPEGKHRHLTHTILFALVVGGVISGLCWICPPLSLAVYAACALLTADRAGSIPTPAATIAHQLRRILRRRHPAVVAAPLSLAMYALRAVKTAERLVIAVAAVGLVPFVRVLYEHPGLVSWQTGLAIALGMITHDLGDALTHSGAPILAGLVPIAIRGETWYEVKLLGKFSFRTNGPVEHWLMFPLLLAATAAAAVQLDPLAGLAAQLPTSPAVATLLVAPAAAVARLVHLAAQQLKKHPVLAGR